ncbi:MAG: MotA/TolQ/ExbB proton channel family protein [Gemmatimonadaceae bacterium]
MMQESVAGILMQISAIKPQSTTTALDMVLKAGPLAKSVLALLGALSAISWGIMFAKWVAFRRAEKAGREFVHDFERADTIDEATIFAKRAKPNPYVAVYTRAVRFLDVTRPALSATSDRTARLSASQVEALKLVLDAESSNEREGLGKYISWLATIGSVSPLIGLFGTVVGVISAFIGIQNSGSGNLSAVAPGIAEALIATAAALAVAIPAAFAYNLFATRLNRLDNRLESFGSELIALMVREEKI